MVLKVGDKVVYPNQGPCRVDAIVKKQFGGKSQKFYPLAVLDDSGDVLFVPVARVKTLGIRRLMRRSEIPKLLSRLSQKTNTGILPPTIMNWKQRAIENSALLASGSAFDLAKIIGPLTQLSGAKTLSPRDRWALDRARKNLICEIAEVMGETISAAEEELDKALKVTKGRMGNSERRDPGSGLFPVRVSIKKMRRRVSFDGKLKWFKSSRDTRPG
jgi:CarD family transcriptional regulator